MDRLFIGVDWAEQEHVVWIGDASGNEVRLVRIEESREGFSELGRWLDEQRAAGAEIFAGIERPDGRMVEFLLGHGAVVYALKMRRHTWDAFVREHRMARNDAAARWEKIRQKPLAIPDHVIRTRSRRLRPLVAELHVLVDAVSEYEEEIRSFFARTPTARLTETLPVGGDGVLIASVFAEMGDAPGRWESVAHLQAQAGVVPVTQRSGKRSGPVLFRTACNKRLRYALTQYAFTSLRGCHWAAAYYKQQRARGHEHNRALRALAAKWAKIFFVIWQRRIPYDDNHHLATIAKQQFIQAT